jgi:GT2 family glycosyltransferase
MADDEPIVAAKYPSIWIVVLNWNGLTDTLACLQSLRQVRYAGRHIVVVDNGSSDGSVAALRGVTQDHEFELIEAGSNLGYAGGNNLGIRYALDHSADFVLVLNNDTTVDPMLLDELVAAADRHPQSGCFGPWIYYMHDRERLWFARAAWSSKSVSFSWPGKDRLASELLAEATRTDYVCGAALFFRADVVRQIGYLDERFFLVYEESDWCYRARRAGFECLTVPKARVWHKVGTSFGSEDSPLRTYFSMRNKLLWAEKNATRAEWFRLLQGAIRRLYPGIARGRGAGIPAHKVLLWAWAGFVRESSRKRSDPQEAAHRQAVLDYMLRRFGDCPPKIRALARAWSDARNAEAVTGSLVS